MKKALKKLDNKGFTLVELIIVIAIIAVLAAVLAPQYIKYLENSRISVDENAATEIAHTIQVAIANEDVYTELGTAGATITVSTKSIAQTAPTAAAASYNDSGAVVTGTASKLLSEIKAAVPKAPEFKSNLRKAGTYTIVVAYVTADKTYTVTGNW